MTGCGDMAIWIFSKMAAAAILDLFEPEIAPLDPPSPKNWASECPDVNYKWRLNPVWHRMLYSCTHMATVGFKGLMCWYVTELHICVDHDAVHSLVHAGADVRPWNAFSPCRAELRRWHGRSLSQPLLPE